MYLFCTFSVAAQFFMWSDLGGGGGNYPAEIFSAGENFSFKSEFSWGRGTCG